jgi:hypothetical protein
MRRPLTDFRLVKQKACINGNDFLVYLIEIKMSSGRWYPASARTFSNENDAIKYVKEELR